jgi:proteasomal ATPase-associated factor 1
LEINTENKLLLVGCEDGFVYCVALKSRQQLFSISLGSAVNCIAFVEKDGCFVVGCQNGVINKYSLFDSSTPKKTWSESNSAVLTLLDFKDGFLDSRADGTTTFRLQVSPEAESKSVVLTGPNFDPVYDLSSDGSNVFTCCRDGIIRKYPLENVLNNFF